MAKGRGGGGGQNTVMSWSILLSSLALFLLIMLILFGNLSGNVGFGDDSTAITVTNETEAWLNITGYTLSNSNSSTSTHVLTAIWGNTPNTTLGGYNFTIPTANGTITTAGVVTNSTEVFNATIFDNLSFSYTLNYATPSIGLTNTNNFISNYTTSVLNVSKQFPVVGTIIGIALLLLILIGILVFALRKMGAVSSQGGGGNFG